MDNTTEPTLYLCWFGLIASPLIGAVFEKRRLRRGKRGEFNW